MVPSRLTLDYLFAGERKNMNLPGVIVDLPTVTDQDIDDIVNFGVRYGVDMIAASFVRKASDIDVIRNVLGPAGKHIKIIAKIENQEGLQNYDAILEKVDGTWCYLCFLFAFVLVINLVTLLGRYYGCSW